MENSKEEGGAGREEGGFVFLEEGVQVLCIFCVSISWCV